MTTTGRRNRQNALQTLGVDRKVVPARDIVVLQEVTQYSDVLEASLHSVVGLSQSGGVGFTRELESLDDGIVPGKIEDGVQGSGTLELRSKRNVVSEDFADAENATLGAEVAPEVVVHVFGSWKTVEADGGQIGEQGAYRQYEGHQSSIP